MKQTSILNKLLLILILLSLFSCNENEDPKPIDPDPEPVEVNLFVRGGDGYSCYRIPAIVKTNAGTLLAFAEGRKNGCADEGNIDLVLKRSTDNGKTWSPLSVVWNDGVNVCGNPAPVVDRRTGKIFLLMSWNHGDDDIGVINKGEGVDTRRVYVTSSTDDGVTWSEPKEITSSVKLPTWGWYATGPCHGIQIQNGQYAGRLVIPCDNIELKSEGGKGHSHVIYSDDGGDTWELGNIEPENVYNPNESTVAELPDGSLMLNMRSRYTDGFRLVSTSSDGGQNWSEPEIDYELPDPGCQGSLLSAEINGQHTMFFSNPANSTNRKNMTIKMSIDNGNTWTKSYLVHTQSSAYSDLVKISDDEIAILYEHGISVGYERIVYKVIPLTEFN